MDSITNLMSGVAVNSMTRHGTVVYDGLRTVFIHSNTTDEKHIYPHLITDGVCANIKLLCYAI